MPAADFAKILGTVFKSAEAKASQEEDKFNKSRQEDIAMYQKVLFDKDSSPEQREKAANEIAKLRNLKKKDSPFHKVAGLLNKVKEMHGKGSGNPGQGPLSGETNGIPNAPMSKSETSQNPSNVGQPEKKPGFGSGVKNALGRMVTGQGLLPRPKQPELPKLDSSVFGGKSPEQQAADRERERTEKGKDLESELSIRDKYIEKQIKLRGEEAQKTAAARVAHAMSSKVKYPGQALINALPEAERSKMLDANGLPVDPHGIYSPIAGENVGIDHDEEGRPILTGVRVGSDSTRERTSEQIVYNPETHQFQTFATHGSSSTPQPPKAPSGDGTKPTLKTREKASPGSNTGQGGVSKAGSKTAGGRSLGGLIPRAAFGGLQKQSNAITEARNSLIGDDPSKTGGIAGDIDIFKNPESVDRVGKYIKYVNSQLEEQGRMASAMGPMAAAEWYLGLPGAISNLQQEKIADYANKLDGGQQDGPEHQFVADYYRLLGTWGGMRAATGASAARWSFRNLISEMPTPGPVTTYADAQRRVINMANESNVVAKNNPMVPGIKVGDIFPKDNKSKRSNKDVDSILRKHGVLN